jgi:hypothetical protein
MDRVLLVTPTVVFADDQFIEVLSQVPKFTDNVISLAVFIVINTPKR